MTHRRTRLIVLDTFFSLPYPGPPRIGPSCARPVFTLRCDAGNAEVPVPIQARRRCFGIALTQRGGSRMFSQQECSRAVTPAGLQSSATTK